MRKETVRDRKTLPVSSSRIRSLLLPGILAILALGVAYGTSKFISRSSRYVVLDRLPELPDFSAKTKELKSKVTMANSAIRKALEDGEGGEILGESIGHLGKLYQANHYYDRAISCYQLAMELDQQDPRWPYLLAFVHQERGENESVTGLLERVIAIAPSYSPAILKLADSYFKLGQADKAETYYKRRLGLSPGDPYALLGLARIALDRLDWKAAQGHLEAAIQSDPRFGDAHRLLATVHNYFGRMSAAEEALDQAGQCPRFRPSKDPWVDTLQELCYDIEQLLVLGAKAITEFDVEKAMNEFFRRAIELDPESVKANLAMGKALFMIGEIEQALKYLNKVIDLNPNSDEAYFHMGLIFRKKSALKDAEKLFLKALSLQPDNANVHNNLGVTLLERGRFQEAKEYLNKALEIYPEHINARYNLGMTLWGMGKVEEAVKQYRDVLEMKPKWAVAANSLAWILATDKNQRLRDGEEAIRWALVACAGDGRKNPDYLDTLAAAYAEAGYFEQAIKAAEECLTLAEAVGDINLSQDVTRRIQLYREKEPFHK